MVKVLFDTNILIDFLNGIAAARAELRRFPDKAISQISWMEVMVGATSGTEATLRGFLAGFVILPVDTPVAERAVVLRRRYKIKLPDAIVWASAQCHDRLLVTRNTKDFAANEPGVLVPYLV